MPGTKLIFFKNNLRILWHPICNWLYMYKNLYTHVYRSVYICGHACAHRDAYLYDIYIYSQFRYGGTESWDISINSQFCIGCNRILMGFIMSTMFLPGTNRKSHGQNYGTLTKLRNNFKILCNPICTWLCTCELI